VSRAAQSEVLVLGTSCLDVKAQPLSAVVPATSNPARIRFSPGGSGRNIAENLSRLGVDVALLSAVGDDLLGQRLIDRTAEAGVDVTRVIRSPEYSTGAYLAMFTEEGHQGYVLDDVSQLKAATPAYVRKHARLFRTAKMAVLDGNLERETVAAALQIARRHDVPMCFDPASVRRAYALRDHLTAFHMVTPNAAEAGALLDMSISGVEDALEAAKRMVSSGVEIAVVTMAENGLVYVTSQGLGQGYGRIPAPRCEVVDWTGAGDALMAAIVYGLLNEMPVDDCMRLGVSAAALALASPQSVNPAMSLEMLYANMSI
jgi:pseudouridine kinase